MTRRTRVLAFALVLLVASTMAPAGAVGAQESSTTTAENSTGEGDEVRDVVREVDSNVVITNYSYDADEETFFVTMENRGDSDVDVTITEIIDRNSKGARSFGITVAEVEAGETVRAQVDAARVNGAAGVMVLTNEAIETGSGVYLQESRQTDNRLIKGESSGAHVRSAAGFTGFGTAALMFFGAWQYVATRNRDVQEPNLDPSVTLLGRFRRWRR